jgi:hypothetical protein
MMLLSYPPTCHNTSRIFVGRTKPSFSWKMSSGGGILCRGSSSRDHDDKLIAPLFPLGTSVF